MDALIAEFSREIRASSAFERRGSLDRYLDSLPSESGTTGTAHLTI